jgi:hypothetical protein
MENKHKNPLNVLFGAFIQEERRKLTNININELCQKGMLGMSISLYKMTEAGNTSFNLTRIPNLIRVFKDSDMIFDRVVKLVAGQNYLDYLITNHKETAKNSFAELAKIDEEFRCLFEDIEKYFEYKEGTKEYKEFIQIFGIEHIKAFLQNTKYPLISETRDSERYFSEDNAILPKEFKEPLQFLLNPYYLQIVTKIMEVPSLSMGPLFDFIKSYSHIIPMHLGRTASDWENENYKNFKGVSGLYAFPELIVSEKNLSIFNHLYLNEESFKGVQYFFIDKMDFKDENHIRDVYFEILNNQRELKEMPLVPEKMKQKIFIQIIPKDKKEKALELLRNPSSPGKHLQAFWYFDILSSANKIGFTGISNDDGNIVYNLSLADVEIRANKFIQLQKSLS